MVALLASARGVGTAAVELVTASSRVSRLGPSHWVMSAVHHSTSSLLAGKPDGSLVSAVENVVGAVERRELIRGQSTGREILVIWSGPRTVFCIDDLSDVHFVPLQNGATPTYQFTRGAGRITLTIDLTAFRRLQRTTLPDGPCS